MFKDTPEGTTHYLNDGCGEPAHNGFPNMVLADFVSYCKEHPTERFWQALLHWSGQDSIAVVRRNGFEQTIIDTFYFEGKNG